MEVFYGNLEQLHLGKQWAAECELAAAHQISTMAYPGQYIIAFVEYLDGKPHGALAVYGEDRRKPHDVIYFNADGLHQFVPNFLGEWTPWNQRTAEERFRYAKLWLARNRIIGITYIKWGKAAKEMSAYGL